MNATLLVKLLIDPVNIEYIDGDIPSYAKNYLDYSESFGFNGTSFIK